jgi:MarR family transcriptional regulator, organic hydroperoxide resistance regulator
MDDHPRREGPTTGYLVWRLLLKWRTMIDRELAPLELTHAQYSLLASLYGLSRGGRRPSQRELADFSGLEPVYVSKLIRAMERSGLVERDPSPEDPRAVQLRLSERGLPIVKKTIRIVRGIEEVQLAPLGGPTSQRSDELRAMLRILLSIDEEPNGPNAAPDRPKIE